MVMVGDDLLSGVLQADNSTPNASASRLGGPSSAIAAAVLCAICILSMMGNIMVLYVVMAHLRFKTVTNAFITALSLADLCCTFVCMPMAFVTVITGTWVFGNEGCLANGTVSSSCVLLSTIMLTFITIDRYFVVVKLPRGQPLGVSSAVLLIAAIAVIATLISIPWYIMNDQRTHYYRYGYQHCNYIAHLSHPLYSGGALFGCIYLAICFCVPSILMVFCTVSLWKIIHRSDFQIRPVAAPTSTIRFNGEMRTAKTVVIMVLLFFVTRVPYVSVAVFYGALGKDIPVAVDTAVMWILWTSCAVNPVIYALRNPTVAQFLRLGKRRAEYAPDRHGNLTISHIGAQTQTPTPSPVKSLAVKADIRSTPDLSCSAVWENKDDRSDSLPSVLLFRTSMCSRKGSGFSFLTTSTSTTNL